MAIICPKKIGEPSEIFPRKYGKVMLQQRLRKLNGFEYDFLYFDYRNRTKPSIVLPLTSAEEVIAIRQYREAADEVILEIPGGNPKAGESHLNVAYQELLEETGYQPQNIISLSPCPIWFEPASVSVPYYPLLAINCSKIVEPHLDDTESIEVTTIPFSRWLQMINLGMIVDSKTIVTTYLALPHLGYTIIRD